MTLCETESFLRTNRLYYDAGMRLTDPREVIRPLTSEDARRQEEQLLMVNGRPLSDYLS